MAPYKCLFGYSPRLEESDASLCLEAAQACAIEFMREGMEKPAGGASTAAAGVGEEPAAGASTNCCRWCWGGACWWGVDCCRWCCGGDRWWGMGGCRWSSGFATKEECLVAVGGMACDTVLQFDKCDVYVHDCLWENENGDMLYHPCTVVGFADGKHTLRYWRSSTDQTTAVPLWTGDMKDEAYTVFLPRRRLQGRQCKLPIGTRGHVLQLDLPTIVTRLR
ncbi:hypothetical protein CYMTET_13772 [Cymbomonas tetramitiformis]|uniref:Uncharacterized protein n=1 Tax=Cymbomonas tetramitiformis TaxID=36881 RepID=A0AAE0GHU1_9CHLO|nr:hypothetical protein CYMTET_13772 [Cymbomonas tetramitiformis]